MFGFWALWGINLPTARRWIGRIAFQGFTEAHPDFLSGIPGAKRLRDAGWTKRYLAPGILSNPTTQMSPVRVGSAPLLAAPFRLSVLGNSRRRPEEDPVTQGRCGRQC